jgi:transposase
LHPFLTGVYSMQEIADHFGVHYSTVSRAVRWFEAEDAPPK